ncbi:MAG: AraC family transcriptional regulator [Verrucomicrobiota bacterium]
MNFSLIQPQKAAADQPPDLPGAMAALEELFDHVRETAFFLKDIQGRYLAVNQSMVQRCRVRDKHDLIGRHVREIYPKELAEVYAREDQLVLKTGHPILERLELHWYESRKTGWCLTTKLPIRNAEGRVMGLVGISHDLRAPGDSDAIPARLASALEALEAHPEDPHSPRSLARQAGLPSVRFARMIKRIFRISPNQLIMQTRLTAAAQLLRETERSIADIAHATGFYDHSAMTRAFRSATGMTPTQFREAGG